MIDPDPTLSAPLLPTGDYRVAGADGKDVHLGHAITVSVSENRIEVTSQCVTPRWTYHIARRQLRTASIPEPICERMRYPAIAVFDDPQDIVHTHLKTASVSAAAGAASPFFPSRLGKVTVFMATG